MQLKDYLEQRQISITSFAKALGCHQPDLTRWANGSRAVPLRWCVRIEQYTGGAVSRRDLRPDDYSQIWPELTAPVS